MGRGAGIRAGKDSSTSKGSHRRQGKSCIIAATITGGGTPGDDDPSPGSAVLAAIIMPSASSLVKPPVLPPELFAQAPAGHQRPSRSQQQWLRAWPRESTAKTGRERRDGGWWHVF